MVFESQILYLTVILFQQDVAFMTILYWAANLWQFHYIF